MINAGDTNNYIMGDILQTVHILLPSKHRTFV
jgi:hypothetical protein